MMTVLGVRNARLSPIQAIVALVIGAAASVVAFLSTTPDIWLPAALLAFALAWASVVDVDRQILPDVITLGLTLAGLAFVATAKPDALPDSIIGALIGYASLAAVAITYRAIRKRDGIGYGDAKLFAAGGAWLGWSALPMVMLVGAATAIAFLVASAASGRRLRSDSALAFGPFIALGIWTMFLINSAA